MLEVHGGLLFWTWLTFLLVLVVLAKTVWRPMLTMLDERESKINKSLEDAERAAATAVKAEEKFNEKLEMGRKEAVVIIKESKEKAEKVKDNIIYDAQQKSQTLVAQAEQKIVAEKTKALEEIRAEVVELSLMIASKILDKNVDDKANRALVSESLKLIEKRNEA